MRHFLLLVSIITVGIPCFWSCKNAADKTTTGNKIVDSTIVSDTSTGWALLNFEKLDSVNPILQPGIGSFTEPVTNKRVFWEQKDVFNPAIVVKNDTVFMLYRAQDKVGKPDGTSRIGLAYSTDAIHFTRNATPVLYPENDAYKKYEWPGGCEDPRIVEDDKGTYYMTYTSYDGKMARLLVATSANLLHWDKKGPAFAKAYNGKYIDKWSKSGSIVSTYTNGKIVATKIMANIGCTGATNLFGPLYPTILSIGHLLKCLPAKSPLLH